MKENMKRYWTFTVIITLIVLVLGWLNGYNFGRAGGMSLANSLTEKFEQVTADQGASLREQETLINTCIEAANELLKQRQELYGQRQELLEHNQKLIEQLLMRPATISPAPSVADSALSTDVFIHLGQAHQLSIAASDQWTALQKLVDALVEITVAHPNAKSILEKHGITVE
jgi:hypothetical protein